MAVHKFKTTDIKGKPYVEVNERIKYFRTHPDYAGWSMQTNIIEHADKAILMQAIVIDDKGVARATGFGRERDGDGFINKTSYVENCETSAWGRALANMGIGVDTSIASANEVENAIHQQEASKIIEKKKPAPAKKKVVKKKAIDEPMYERMKNALGQGMFAKVEESLSGFNEEGKWFDAISILIEKSKADAKNKR